MPSVHYGVEHPPQGFIHAIGAELGIALSRTILACGDCPTATVGGIGARGIGVGTSGTEHVLATQTPPLRHPKPMRIRFEGTEQPGVTATDLVLFAIGQLGVDVGRSRAVEHAGTGIRALPVDGRLTIDNMSIEHGAWLRVTAPDDATVAYLAGPPFAPRD